MPTYIQAADAIVQLFDERLSDADDQRLADLEGVLINAHTGYADPGDQWFRRLAERVEFDSPVVQRRVRRILATVC